MSVDTAVWNTGLRAQFIPCYTPPDTPRAEDEGSRSSSPCPSLNSSGTTIEPGSDGEDGTVNSAPGFTDRPPIMSGAKYHDGVIYMTGGTQEPDGAGGLGPEGTGSAKSDQAVDREAYKPASHPPSDDQTCRNRRDDGDDGPKAPAPGARAVSDMTLRAEENRYACPYRKWNPVRFNIREHRGCSSEGFNIARLKYVNACLMKPNPPNQKKKNLLFPNSLESSTNHRPNAESTSRSSMARD